jgi:hypothetical protein
MTIPAGPDFTTGETGLGRIQSGSLRNCGRGRTKAYCDVQSQTDEARRDGQRKKGG